MNPIQRLRSAADQQLPQAPTVEVHKLDLDSVLNSHAQLLAALKEVTAGVYFSSGKHEMKHRALAAIEAANFQS